MAKDKNEFKITLTGEGLNLSRNVREVIAHQIVALVLGGAVSASTMPTEAMAIGPHGEPTSQRMTPKAFMALKRPATDIERITCLAWYLTHERNTLGFKTKELTELNREAAQFKLSNPSATARNAVSDGFLAPSGGGQKQITARGEAIVVALPDREQVKRALDDHPKARRRKLKTKA